MPLYFGTDGQIYNHPVPGGTLIDGGDITPPRPGGNTGTYPTPNPPRYEVGFFRKSMFWLMAMGGALGMAYAMGNILSNHIFADSGLDGIAGGVSGMLMNAAPVLMCIIAFITCIICGVGAGEDNNYNLVGLIISLLATGGISLAGAVVLALLPYAAALIGAFFGICILIGIIAALIGGG